MTDEASMMVVVARAALEGALRAALPHVARRIPEDAPDNGAGLLRLAVPAAVQLLDFAIQGVQGSLNLVRLILDVGGKLLNGGKRYLDVFAH